MSNTIESPSAILTPLEDIPPRPTLVAETTQGSHLTTSSINPKIVVLCSPLEELPLDNKDVEGSNILSTFDTEVRTEADIFLQTFNSSA